VFRGGIKTLGRARTSVVSGSARAFNAEDAEEWATLHHHRHYRAPRTPRTASIFLIVKNENGLR
jgi:hypothetical protein